MAHAVIRTGGKQFLVQEGKTIRVPSVDAEAGKAIELDVLVASGDKTKVGVPAVEGVKVSATVVDHGRAPKIIVFKRSGANSTSASVVTARITQRSESIRLDRAGLGSLVFGF